MTPIRVSITRARQMAVESQLLSAPRPTSLVGVVEHLGWVQVDPTNAVARAERLVLWSRLGNYDVADLDRARFETRELLEHAAYILPMTDFAVHRPVMASFPTTERVREWMTANAEFRRYVLGELRRRGPLRSRELDDRAEVPWRSGGWNDGKSLGRMLEFLWAGGHIAVVGRDGNERVWDLADRHYPVDVAERPPIDVARRLIERQLRCRGVGRVTHFGWGLNGLRPDRWEDAQRELLSDGTVVPVEIAGLAGEWFAHRDALDASFRPRTTLLCPFDRLVYIRERTEELFVFHYRLEMYVPKSKRRYGYYVLPILDGHRLVGRADPFFDRRTATLRINAVYAEDDAPASAGRRIAAAIVDLARWLGAADISLGEHLPQPWAGALRRAASKPR